MSRVAAEQEPPASDGGRARWSWWRALGWVLVFGLAAGSAVFLIGGVRWGHRFEGWVTADPVGLEADLGVPARYSAPFHQTCAVAHAEVFGVEFPVGAPADPEAAMRGLRATLTLEDSAGRALIREHVPDEYARRWPGWEWPMEPLLRSEASVPEGDYTMTLVVHQGADGLAGVRARIVARYELCGLELMPATFMNWIGIGLGVLGVVVGLPMAATAQRWRRQVRLAA